MRRNFAVGVILILGSISILLLGVMVPFFTERKVNGKTQHETVPIGVTLFAFVLLFLGVGLIAIELFTGGLAYTRTKKKKKGGDVMHKKRYLIMKL